MEFLFRIIIVLGVFLSVVPRLYSQQDSALTVDKLPDPVQNELADKYKKYEVRELEMKEKAGKQLYQVKVQKKNNVFTLRYDLDGVLVSKTKSKSYRFDSNERPKERDPGAVGPPPMPNL